MFITFTHYFYFIRTHFKQNYKSIWYDSMMKKQL